MKRYTMQVEVPSTIRMSVEAHSYAEAMEKARDILWRGMYNTDIVEEMDPDCARFDLLAIDREEKENE